MIKSNMNRRISNTDRISFYYSSVAADGKKKYFEAFMKFADIRTLPERMKDEETLAMEYRMKDGVSSPMKVWTQSFQRCLRS